MVYCRTFGDPSSLTISCDEKKQTGIERGFRKKRAGKDEVTETSGERLSLTQENDMSCAPVSCACRDPGIGLISFIHMPSLFVRDNGAPFNCTSN